MDYNSLIKKIASAGNHICETNQRIKMVANVLGKYLSDKYDFPANSLCLQPLGADIKDNENYTANDAVSMDSVGRDGFRVKFICKGMNESLMMTLVSDWTFVLKNAQFEATNRDSKESFKINPNNVCDNGFIDAIAHSLIETLSSHVERFHDNIGASKKASIVAI
ncbi:hypothetical protein [Rubritalea sp.]|uniref:hypothetical protein n=1 Tax=Rubritalea sp. TaxID=2109375 RepID=UPI003EF792BE